MATRIRSPISPMSGHSPATRPLAIQTGSWLAPEALADTRRRWRFATACCVLAIVCSTTAATARHARHSASRTPPQQLRHLPYPPLELPLQISGGQYLPLAWSEVAGWNDDDHLAAYKTFRASCKPIAA